MQTDAITIDVYDVYGKKLIKGITPVNPTKQTLPSLKTIEINEKYARTDSCNLSTHENKRFNAK